MKRHLITVFGLLSLMMIFSLPATYGQESTSTPEEEWSRLSAEQKATLRERYRALKELTPEQQKEIRDRLKQFREMNRQERERILENYRGYKKVVNGNINFCTCFTNAIPYFP